MVEIQSSSQAALVLEPKLDSRRPITDSDKGRYFSTVPSGYTSREGHEKVAMPDRTAENLATWEGIRDKAEPKIAALVEKTRASIPNDKSLARFRTACPVAQFYEILEVRANQWVSEVHKICRDARESPNDSETKNFKQAVFDFVIEPFIDDQLFNLMLEATGFKSMERQLAKRGDRELRAYMPDRYPSLTVNLSRCRHVKERVRSRWMQELVGRKASGVSPDRPAVDTQEFRLSNDGRSLNWNGEQHALSPQQAHVIQILHTNYESGTPDVGDHYILEELGTTNKRLRDTFKNSPLWNTLIVSKKKGTHRLDPKNGS